MVDDSLMKPVYLVVGEYRQSIPDDNACAFERDRDAENASHTPRTRSFVRLFISFN